MTEGNGGHGNGVEVKGPGGWGVRATGNNVVLILVLIAGFAGLGYIMHTGLSSVATADARNQVEHAALVGSQRDLVCMLALPMEVREAAARSGDVCRYLMLRGTDEGARPRAAAPPPRSFASESDRRR